MSKTFYYSNFFMQGRIKILKAAALVLGFFESHCCQAPDRRFLRENSLSGNLVLKCLLYRWLKEHLPWWPLVQGPCSPIWKQLKEQNFFVFSSVFQCFTIIKNCTFPTQKSLNRVHRQIIIDLKSKITRWCLLLDCQHSARHLESKL